MSKIYEALLRAEMDRVSQLNRTGEPEELPSEEDRAKATPAPFVNGSGAHGAGALANSNGRSHTHALASSHTAVREVAWHPDEVRLPALQSRGVLVEQVRVLRSRLSELRLDRSLKTILVTSGLPEEGKSFVAANLAVALAKSRQTRVLLIDGDMRRGTLHKVLGTEQEPGLSEYLAGTATPDQIMQQIDTSQAGALKSLSSLTFIASGVNGDNAADLSGNGRFEVLLRTLSNDFEWIIVDSSPVTLVSDGVNLARYCDGVLLVARAGVTKYEIAQRALQELKASKTLGVVLNAVQDDPRVGGYYGYDS